MLHRVKVFWHEPPITAQGSQTGQFKSSIQDIKIKEFELGLAHGDLKILYLIRMTTILQTR